MSDLSEYRSPFSWRYASPEMRDIWSEEYKRKCWRKIWVALAQVQQEYGLVKPDQVADLVAHQDQIDLPRAMQIEEELQHDLMAEVHTYAEQAKIGGGIIHFGATSMDIEDNAEAMRLKASLDLINKNLRALLGIMADLITTTADLPLIAFTHLQPAEPSTLGYRLAQTGQDLLTDYDHLISIAGSVKGKGFKGAVGTAASYSQLFGADQLEAFEEKLSVHLNLPFYPIATQTYPRKQDYFILSALAALAQTIYKFGFDLRFLQSPPIGELSEPFGSRQIGSSAMPFKRNPIRSEKLDSLGRYVAQLPRIAWDNAAHSLLERTLDDSANRRVILPEGFLAIDEMLKTITAILSDLRINHAAIERNLKTYGPFAATEKVLLGCVQKGADRQEMHEVIRQLSMKAWESVQQNSANPLLQYLAEDAVIRKYLSATELATLMDHTNHIGYAPKKARELALELRQRLAV